MHTIKGNTYGVSFDLKQGKVWIADELYIDNTETARLYYEAYALGREHKKLEIRHSIGV